LKSTGALGTISTLTAATGYGSAYVVARIAYDYGLNSLTLNFLRFLVLVALLTLWIAVKHGDFRLPHRAVIVTLFMGFLIACAGVTNFAAIAFIPVSLAILIFYTYPLVTLILNSIVERRAPARADYLAFACAFVGLALILEVSVDELNVVGVLLALTGSLTAGAHLVVAQHAMRIAKVSTVILYMSLSACVISGLVTIASGELSLPTPGAGVWLLVYVIAAFCVGMGSMLTGVRLIGPVRTSIIMCMEPPVVIGCAYLLLGERLGPVQLLGATLVIAGIIIAQSPTRPHPDK
jgi:drug/metabolite transporter (DMT)-like permease